MKEMLGYQVNELAAALKMPLSFKLIFKAFDPTTLIEIAVYFLKSGTKDSYPLKIDHSFTQVR